MRKPVIICTGESGRAVVFGYVEGQPKIGSAILIYKARMILYWPSSCGGLFGLASDGPVDGVRLTSVVSKTQCIPKQWISVSEQSAEALKKWIPYKG